MNGFQRVDILPSRPYIRYSVKRDLIWYGSGEVRNLGILEYLYLESPEDIFGIPDWRIKMFVSLTLGLFNSLIGPSVSLILNLEY